MSAEGETSPLSHRLAHECGVESRKRKDRRRCVLALGALTGALTLYAPAWAEDGFARIGTRIESVFNLVGANSTALAVPLTRRALARRHAEKKAKGPVPPLAYSEIAPDAGFEQPAREMPIPGIKVSAPHANLSTELPAAQAEPEAVIEQGSADDDDEEVARLPRARPARAQDASGQDASGQDEGEAAEGVLVQPSLDLVAGAALPRAAPTPEPRPQIVAEAPAATADEAPEAAVAPEPEMNAAAPAAEEPAEVAAAEATPLPDALPSEVASTGSVSEAAAAEPAPAALALVASGKCLSPADVDDSDGDFERNAAALKSGVCIEEKTFKERRRPWTIQVVRTGRPGPLWAVMHDDENLSFDNAVAALKRYGGTLVAMETGGKRNQDGIDPNRNFSADGIGCSKLGDDAAPEFTSAIAGLIDKSQPIIAVHNNTGKRIPTGGLGHVTMKNVPKDMDSVPARDPSGPLAGGHALVLLVDMAPVSTTSRRLAADLSAHGINAVIENVKKGRGDCSLSNFAALTGHEDYLNVTVDDDEREKQLKIIDTIMGMRPQTVATQ